MKAVSPAIVAPKDGERVNSRTPTLEWENAKGKYVGSVPFTYDVELYRENTLFKTWSVAQANGDRTATTVDEELEYNRLYRWRVRARYGDSFSDFAHTGDFYTPMPPWSPGQPYGPERGISANEALAIIMGYHDRTGANLGSSSTRESRVAFLFAAVASIHYGHPVHNPQGGDRGWCVKDAGGGRPPSDDVIVRCDSRDSWDLVGGAGADGYRFHLDYIGRLSSEQNVYPPPLSSLPR